MGDISAKERVIKLMGILSCETDEFNKLAMDDLIKKLEIEFEGKTAGKFSVEKKAIYDDLKQIEDSGFSISKFADLNLKGKIFYYHHERLFEIYELRLLIDAVSSARFITKDETEKIIEKLKTLTSSGLASKLKGEIHIDKMVKSENTKLKYYLDVIHSAILENKKVSFQYGNYNVNKEFVLRHDGGYYIVNPYGLVWSNDFYYLVCYDEKKKVIVNYRVDRMQSVSMEDEKFQEVNFDIDEHLKSCFNMYPGEVDVVEIQFKKELINAVIDKLGKDMNVSKIDDCTFKVRFPAAINEGLLRWVLMWGADAKVLKPNKLIEMLKNESEKMNSIYR